MHDWLTVFTAVLAAGVVGEAILRVERWLVARAERRRDERERAVFEWALQKAVGRALQAATRKDAN